MLRSLFKRPQKAPGRAPTTPPDTVVWAIGDIHGRLDLLDPLVQGIVADLGESSATRKVIVFLGDYIDRGPASRGVLDLLCRLRDWDGAETHFLRGNHEERMEAFLTDAEAGPGWCEFGGREALRSYGVQAPALMGDTEAWQAASHELGSAMPAEHRAFLAAQGYKVVIGDFFFAHAGARPGVPLDQQANDDLMWIRNDFIRHPDAFELVVVHGHTPENEVQADHRRIGIDTGAYATGVLTALRLEGTRRETLQTQARGRAISLHRTLLQGG